MAKFFNPHHNCDKEQMTTKHLKECYSVDLKTDLDSLSNFDVYYEKWVKECAESAKHSDFQKLSEAICKTAGSMINQHCGEIGSFNQKISTLKYTQSSI